MIQLNFLEQLLSEIEIVPNTWADSCHFGTHQGHIRFLQVPPLVTYHIPVLLFICSQFMSVLVYCINKVCIYIYHKFTDMTKWKNTYISKNKWMLKIKSIYKKNQFHPYITFCRWGIWVLGSWWCKHKLLTTKKFLRETYANFPNFQIKKPKLCRYILFSRSNIILTGLFACCNRLVVYYMNKRKGVNTRDPKTTPTKETCFSTVVGLYQYPQRLLEVFSCEFCKSF